jgi:hypothetical protein
VEFAPILTGPPIKTSRKRTKRTADAAELDAIAIQDDLVRPVDLLGNVNDETSLAYWKKFDEQTGGKLVDRFSYELHEYAVDTCCETFQCVAATAADPKLESLAAKVRTWYLGQQSNQTSMYIDNIHEYTNIYNSARYQPPSHCKQEIHSLRQQTIF